MKIKELQELIAGSDQAIKDLIDKGDSDGAQRYAGKVDAWRQELVDQTNAVIEENRRIKEESQIAASAAEPAAETVGQRFANACRDAGGFGVGDTLKVSIKDAIDPALPTPQTTSYDLPSPLVPILGFLDTIPQGQTDADEHYFKSPVLTNNAAGWVSGDKPESAISWTPDVAHLETIAHWIPIPKMAEKRYPTLQNVVDFSLLLGLRMKKNEFAVRGKNTSGIVGITNQVGLLTYKKSEGENIYDMVVNMSARVKIASGFPANCVALPTEAISALKTAKGTDGHYLYPEIVQNGTIDGKQIVEDNTLAVSTAGDGGTTTTKHGCLVYFSGGAQFNTADADEVTIGLVDKQFIQNTYTMLAEGTYALKVPFPSAFCYCSEVM